MESVEELELLDKGYRNLAAEDDSPYPEVRSSVPNVDDFNMPQNTLRMWTIGLMMTSVGSALNVLFNFHNPAFAITTFVSAIVAWPLGRLWDKLPNWSIFGIPLNPCPFNLKEHGLITIMANVSFGSGAAYITDVSVALSEFYGINFGWGFQIVSVLASQTMGYALAGLARKVLVYPASMIWPANLVTTTFLTNIHVKVNHVANGWTVSRLKFFLIVMSACFVWTWLPEFLAPFLANFGFASWIAPSNIVINQLFGSVNGLGMMPLTFDWAMISGYIGSPLIPPFFAIGNVIAALVIIYWFLVPILHFSNTWYGHYLPISTANVYDRFQNKYDVKRILDSNNQFDEQKYAEYSMLFLPTTFLISYGMEFAAITSTVVFTILYYGRNIKYYWLNSRREPDDVHMRLMKRYKEVPDWWFILTFFVFFGFAIASVRAWPTELPIWCLVIAVLIAIVMLIPVGIVVALTNIAVGLNVVTEFIIGVMLPGKLVAMMLFKTYGYITNNQAVTFISDMKLGHYLKIAPRTLFAAQLIATLWGAVVQIAVLNWAESTIPDLCKANQASKFTCPQAEVFFNASVIWGVIGPYRQFAHTTRPIFFGFLVGVIAPIITWLILKRNPRSFVRYIHWPAFFESTGYIPPATAYMYGCFCVVGWFFGYFVKRKWFSWWAKYNYSLSAGLDLGLALAIICICLLTLNGSITAPKYWGTVGAFQNADNSATPMINLKDNEWFGPETW